MERHGEQMLVRPHFVKVSSYHLCEQVVGADDIKINIEEDKVKGNDLLVLDDLMDTGNTMVKTINKLKTLGAKSVEVAVIFHKRNPKNLKLNFFGKYTGFTIPNEFVFGYGLDYDDMFRELSHLCVVN